MSFAKVEMSLITDCDPPHMKEQNVQQPFFLIAPHFWELQDRQGDPYTISVEKLIQGRSQGVYQNSIKYIVWLR